MKFFVYAFLAQVAISSATFANCPSALSPEEQVELIDLVDDTTYPLDLSAKDLIKLKEFLTARLLLIPGEERVRRVTAIYGGIAKNVTIEQSAHDFTRALLQDLSIAGHLKSRDPKTGKLILSRIFLDLPTR